MNMKFKVGGHEEGLEEERKKRREREGGGENVSTKDLPHLPTHLLEMIFLCFLFLLGATMVPRNPLPKLRVPGIKQNLDELL